MWKRTGLVYKGSTIGSQFRFAVFSVLLIMLCSAHAEIREDDAANGWGAIAEGARLRLTVARDRYRFGDSVDLHIVLQNASREELVLSRGSELPYEVEVISPDDMPAAHTEWGRRQMGFTAAKSGSHRSVRLKRGESCVDDVHTVNRDFDMTLNGQYSIAVRTVVPSAKDADGWVWVFSPTVTIHVE